MCLVMEQSLLSFPALAVWAGATVCTLAVNISLKTFLSKASRV